MSTRRSRRRFAAIIIVIWGGVADTRTAASRVAAKTTTKTKKSRFGFVNFKNHTKHLRRLHKNHQLQAVHATLLPLSHNNIYNTISSQLSSVGNYFENCWIFLKKSISNDTLKMLKVSITMPAISPAPKPPSSSLGSPPEHVAL